MGRLRVGMVGGGFMGRVYSLALGALGGLARGVVPRTELTRFADQSAEAVESLAAAWGWARCGTDWRAVTDDPEVDLVLVLTPNDSHAEIAVAALQAGKHVLCEKPLSNTVGRARAMYHAARSSGRAHQVGFVYRKWPAVQLAQEIVAGGEIGETVHYRGRYFHDYTLNPEMPFSWRLDRSVSGGGAGADIGSHVIDMARFLRGREIVRVSAAQRTHFRDRPVPGGGRRAVDVDDITDMLVEFEDGVPGALQMSWLAGGHKIDLGFAVHGTRGSVEFSTEQPNELRLYRQTDPARESGFKSVPIGPVHPGFELFWPVPGMGLSFADGLVIALRDLLVAIERGSPAQPSFLDGLRASEVVAAAQVSAATRAWADVELSPA